MWFRILFTSFLALDAVQDDNIKMKTSRLLAAFQLQHAFEHISFF